MVMAAPVRRASAAAGDSSDPEAAPRPFCIVCTASTTRRGPLRTPAPRAPMRSAAAVRSLLLAIWPLRRASSCRLAVGCSVFSWPSDSPKAMESSAEQRVEYRRHATDEPAHHVAHVRHRVEQADQPQAHGHGQSDDEHVSLGRGARYEGEGDVEDERACRSEAPREQPPTAAPCCRGPPRRPSPPARARPRD